MSKNFEHWKTKNWSGIRGGCCNPSYWEDRIGGWPLCRRSAKGSKWLAEGSHYTVEWSDTSVPGAVRTQTPPGADPIRILPRSGHQWCLNYSWCGVRLDHRRREAGLSCIPGLTLVSLLDRVEGCYKCQPLRLEAISHTRDAHFRIIRGRSNNNNKFRLVFCSTVQYFQTNAYFIKNLTATNFLAWFFHNKGSNSWTKISIVSE